jgi:ketosteroid isomerase-like protein
MMGVPTLTLSTVEVTELGDTAYEVGSYTMKLQPAGAAVVNDNGKYVVIWNRQGDGSWKLAVDIWNSDLPMPGA